MSVILKNTTTCTCENVSRWKIAKHAVKKIEKCCLLRNKI